MVYGMVQNKIVRVGWGWRSDTYMYANTLSSTSLLNCEQYYKMPAGSSLPPKAIIANTQHPSRFSPPPTIVLTETTLTRKGSPRQIGETGRSCRCIACLAHIIRVSEGRWGGNIRSKITRRNSPGCKSSEQQQWAAALRGPALVGVAYCDGTFPSSNSSIARLKYTRMIWFLPVTPCYIDRASSLE